MRQLQISNSCISTCIESWTHIYMNLFTRNSPFYHLLKYLIFLLKHPVCFYYFTRRYSARCACKDNCQLYTYFLSSIDTFDTSESNYQYLLNSHVHIRCFATTGVCLTSRQVTGVYRVSVIRYVKWPRVMGTQSKGETNIWKLYPTTNIYEINKIKLNITSLIST